MSDFTIISFNHQGADNNMDDYAHVLDEFEPGEDDFNILNFAN